jgi:hypothetical protein
MVRAKHMLIAGQSTFEERLGLAKASLRLIDEPHIADASDGEDAHCQAGAHAPPAIEGAAVQRRHSIPALYIAVPGRRWLSAYAHDRAERSLLAGQGPLVKTLGLGETVLIEIYPGHIEYAQERVGVICAQQPCSCVQHALIEKLGLRIALLPDIDLDQIVDGGNRCGVVRLRGYDQRSQGRFCPMTPPLHRALSLCKFGQVR